ncbi:MAG: SH3 domain-containing protein [Butyrivibrio sp.]|uniref:SH3 domain-containing protein n=1 Tax=Butyrivibrio sp. TaxID=28121 RepID=UPI0025B95C8C|nr:SH3 domain-containing protein [Butyrivibrio sp.]MBQ6589760.1 SH3 domain-containing protein [Butyrivibrio sp.]
MYKEKKKNLIILIAFSAVFCTALGFGMAVSDKPDIDTLSATNFSSETVVRTITDDTINAVAETADEYEEYLDTTLVAKEENAAELTLTAFTVTEYENVARMFASDTVNVRAGAGTDYDRIGKVAWGTEMEVTGVTDNGWFEVLYKDLIGYIRGDYMVEEMPGIPYLFVGDSRTVQMQMAVGSTDKAYIAKIGEGYSYFKNTAIGQIPSYAGQGTIMIINFGVNDLSNASKYIKLVNDNIDTWENAGITVYYSSVTPVGSCNVSNAQIENFNAALQNGLDSRVHWIDSYSYLMQTGYSTNDGLHYNKETYKNLYSYYMSVVSQQA